MSANDRTRRPDARQYPPYAFQQRHVQLLLLFGGIVGLTALMQDPAHGIWPLAAQVALGVVVAEFPLY
jgi:hypothetical protein